MKTPRKLSLVKCLRYPKEKKLPFELTSDSVLLFLGKIPNMPDHCAVSKIEDGTLIIGLHTDRFKELTEDET